MEKIASNFGKDCKVRKHDRNLRHMITYSYV